MYQTRYELTKDEKDAFVDISPRPSGIRKTVSHSNSFTFLGSLILLGACAAPSPPSAAELQIAATQSSISHAAAMGAVEFAPVEIQSARTRLGRARDAVRSGNVEQSLRLSREAQIDISLAEARLQAVKAEQAASQLDDGQRVLQKEIERKVP